jgi:predicted alpha/beta superfamily hydrolase
MKLISKSIIILLFLHQFVAHSQMTSYGSLTEIYELKSEQGQQYKLKVTLPPDYDGSKTYQTLYYLDAWWLSEIVSGTYAILHIDQKINPVVLVGISLDGDEKDWNVQRTLDFTPSPYDKNIMGVEIQSGRDGKGIDFNPENTGGASRFADFLETQAFGFIESKYPNIEKKRGLLGHSLGGLFGFYLMQQRPQLFSNYIVISPSLWWNKRELLSESNYSEFRATHQNVRMHLSYGSAESGLIRRSNLAMDEVLKSLAPESFDYQFQVYAEADHNSILAQAIYEGLVHCYGK